MACSMAPLYDGHDYYKRMFELQEKLRKRHDICINRLRMRYIQYLEDQRTRDERNHKLLAALDRVMNKLALISAKKDRLNVLRKQYEAYLLRAYANHRASGSVTGDSGIASQNEDKYTKKTVVLAPPDLTSVETRSFSSPQEHLGTPEPQLRQPKSISTSKFYDQVAVDASLNNPSISTATPVSATLDHRQMSVLHRPHVYGSVPNFHQYSRVLSSYDGGSSRDFQHVPDIRVSYAEAPVVTSLDNVQSQAASVNRFFREQMESTQAVSGLSPTRFLVRDTARYEDTSQNLLNPRQFNSLTSLQYHDANMLPDPRLRRREYDPSDTAVVEPTLVTGKSSIYRTGSDVSVANQIGPLPGYMDYILANSQKSDDERSTRSITSDDLDGLIRRNERLLWGKADIAMTPHRLPVTSGTDNANLDENGMTAIVENELDRYISNIRKLHREHAVQSADELDHEQNTSGDLLNVSLSDDALELPVENRARKERIPEEMDKVLTLASDLASETVNLKETARDLATQIGGLSVEVVNGIERREITKSDASEFKETCEAEERATLIRNETRDNVTTNSTEVEQPEDTEFVSVTMKNVNEEMAKSDKLRSEDLRNESREERLDLLIGEESNIKDLFDVTKELAPWNLASVQKNVRELRLDDSDGDQTKKSAEDTVDRIEKENASKSCDSSRLIEQSDANDKVENTQSLQSDMHPRSEIETLNASEVSEQIKIFESVENVENVNNQNSKILNQQSAGEAKIASQPRKEVGESEVIESDEEKQEDNETTELQVDNQFEAKDNKCSVEQKYTEEPSQEQQYEHQDPNQQYYEQNMQYEAGNEGCERYADQGYSQDGQEYIEYVDGQYEQYPEDQQYQHYPDAQYEQNPNQAYDYNYDPNQGYGDPSQQYDPNQGYENSDNQSYNYTDQVPYDSNQPYDNVYEQEYKEEQYNPDGDAEERKPETEEASQKQADSEPEPKSDDTKLLQEDIANKTNQFKKKDVIKSLLDSDTDTTIERNVSNTESDFDFN
ncbi:hypothetical protein PUN28_000709 [Cardiocondyla obscurior]|uniref:Uncharacterized protein n=1 Tax=Cardiocondyla obscurior TaxID=286306 RepID=A0AAW2H0M9_9HYME